MYKNFCILTGYSAVILNALNIRNTRINANPIILFLLPEKEMFIKQKAINLKYIIVILTWTVSLIRWSAPVQRDVIPIFELRLCNDNKFKTFHFRFEKVPSWNKSCNVFLLNKLTNLDQSWFYCTVS